MTFNFLACLFRFQGPIARAKNHYVINWIVSCNKNLSALNWAYIRRPRDELSNEITMDYLPNRRFLGIVALGCGVYVAREMYVMYYMKPWNREEHGYERPPPDGNFPDLRLHNNLMANHLTPDLYNSLR